MTDSVEPLILDLLDFVSREARPYHEVIDAWRTSCPRLPVWEDANERGLVTRAYENGCATVRITATGQAYLKSARSSGRFLPRSAECRAHPEDTTGGEGG